MFRSGTHKQNGNPAAAHRFGGDLVPELLHELVLLLAFGDQAAQLISHFSLKAHDQALVVPTALTCRACVTLRVRTRRFGRIVRAETIYGDEVVCVAQETPFMNTRRD